MEPLKRTVARMLVALAVGSVAAHAQPPRAAGSSPALLDEAFERPLMKETRGRGVLVDVNTGDPGTWTAILVHGIPGAPSSLAPVMRREIAAGHTVKAFAYDNKFRSLEESSPDLANAIEQWMDENPNRKLRLDAHSMGGRVALGALGILEGRGRLTGEVELNLIASPIAGMRRAMFALIAPGFIPWMRPIRGIAPTSRSQRVINALRLPDNVRVNVFVGDKDEVFKHSAKKYRALVQKLHGVLTVFPGATHTSILEEVAHLI